MGGKLVLAIPLSLVRRRGTNCCSSAPHLAPGPCHGLRPDTETRSARCVAVLSCERDRQADSWGCQALLRTAAAKLAPPGLAFWPRPWSFVASGPEESPAIPRRRLLLALAAFRGQVWKDDLIIVVPPDWWKSWMRRMGE